MTHGSLFSGIGGFDVAAQWLGWKNIFQCEKDEFCQRVLRYHFSNVTLYGDITTTDFTRYRGAVDVISGGFPCQPFSIAGKRKGTDDDRHLWPEMLRAIREIEPTWVVAENVRGLLSQERGVVFERVCAEMEGAGYEVQPLIIPACAVGAPHRRDRVWIVAHVIENTLSNGRAERELKEIQAELGQQRNAGAGSADGLHLQQEIIANTSRLRRGTRRTSGEWNEYNTSERTDVHGIAERFSEKQAAANATGNRPQERNKIGTSTIHFENGWFDGFPTQPPVCGRNDGLSCELDSITFSAWRRESIKAYGNAIVPQVAYEIFKAINSVEHEGQLCFL